MLEVEGFRLNFYIPMSYTWKNLERACMRAAATEQKFFFRKNLFDDGPAEVMEMTFDLYWLAGFTILGLAIAALRFKKRLD